MRLPLVSGAGRPGPAGAAGRTRTPLWRRVELPTWIVVLVAYGGWLSVTWHYHRLPVWLVLPLAAGILTLHGSLQHEAIHGHPTRWRVLNAWVVGVPLSLWLPYSIYRESHLAHHRAGRLTDPLEDPESYYITPAIWRSMGSVRRALRHAQATLVGRVLLGPPAVVARFFLSEWGLLRREGRRAAARWLQHLAACALVLGWVLLVCRIPLWAYLVLFVYSGLSLTLIRSFTEHRPAASQDERTAVVETGLLMSLLFLNNNLHAVHHDAPGLPWYKLPGRYRRDREAVLSRNGRFLFRGYGEILGRYALRAKDLPVHPDA
jgi:fatty acid desaturase